MTALENGSSELREWERCPIQSSLHLPEPKKPCRPLKCFLVVASCHSKTSPRSAHPTVAFLQSVLSLPALLPSLQSPGSSTHSKVLAFFPPSHSSQIPGPPSTVFVVPCVCVLSVLNSDFLSKESNCVIVSPSELRE